MMLKCFISVWKKKERYRGKVIMLEREERKGNQCCNGSMLGILSILDCVV